MSRPTALNSPAAPISPCVNDDSPFVQQAGSDPELASFLTQMFALMSENWARDFLFKMDATADVCALSSPAQLQYGMVIELILSIFETNESYGGMFNLDVNLRWLIVPVFSVRDISAEIIVQARKTVSNRAVGTANDYGANIRMIRSDRNGDLLFAIDDAETGEINMSLFRNETTTRRKRLWLRAKRELFLEAVLGSPEIDFKKLQQSVTLTIEFNEVRCCPICNLPPGAGCRCKFTYNLPRHPMDFTYCRSNMVPHKGYLTGSAKMTLYSSGVQFAQGLLSVSTTVETTSDPGCVRSLVEWGIQKKMQAVSVVPTFGLSPLRLRDDAMSFCTIPSLNPDLQRNRALHPVGPDTLLSLHDGLASIARSSTIISKKFSYQAVEEDAMSFLPGPDLFFGSTGNESMNNYCDVGVNNALRIQSFAHRNAAFGSNAPQVDENQVQSQNATDREKMSDPIMQRRIKNREAAARSNLRRKQRNDALKQSLAEILEREEQLRKRETELKLENAKLRSQMYGS